MRKCYLVSTDHLEEGLWFRDDEDFITGMNYVAIQAARGRVIVLAFILMSNHLHFVVNGRWEDVKAFIYALKCRYSRYLRSKYGDKEFLRRNRVDIQEVEDVEDAVRRVIAYVQMNCVAANICLTPSQYPWGTGDVFFSSSQRTGTRIDQLSKRKLMKLMHTNDVDALPSDWLIGPGGYILPECYVNKGYVEQLYGTPNRMNYFLNTSSKAQKRLESASQHLPSFKDQIILAALPDLYRTMFGKRHFGDLDSGEQTECLRQIRYRFSADPKQIARVVGITYADAAKLLDRS